ncbi:lipopolysaccharide biosynthesis protein [Actinomadura viridis]|uniref:O-antigen/teichoic acid export membrane protein n=1 Tax=Actinomadura viridis TaxID=58110 RepID=A0A931GTP1_9ACTN|nr:polysaccharide biosynthesis C-terminal domain-containing protein [Actinomadura viridis]MBG6092239.1 O-antigen/teichoic acid export membrane protein [Actinomadura viridis]
MSTSARRVAHTVTTRVVSLLLSGVSGIVITRALQPEGRGAYYVVVTIALIALSIGHLSVAQSHVWMWTEAGHRPAITANSAGLGLGVGALAALTTAGVVLALGPGTVPAPGHGDLAWALAAIPFAMAVLYLNTVLVLKSRVDVVNRGAVLGASVQCGLLVLLAVRGISPGQAVMVWALSMIVPLAVLVPAARPRLRHGDLGLARLAIGKGLRYHTGLAALFLLFRTDVLMLDRMTTAAAVGLYSLAVTVAEQARLTTDAIAQVVLPRQIDTGHDEAAAVTARATRFTALFALGSVVAICAAAPVAIPLVYGSAFAGAVPALLGLAPGLLFLGATRPIGAFLLRLDRPLLGSAISVAALVLNIVLNLWLIPAHGIVGAAAASSVAYAMVALLQSVWFLRATGAPLRSLLPGPGDLAYVWAKLAGARLMRRAASRRAS